MKVIIKSAWEEIGNCDPRYYSYDNSRIGTEEEVEEEVKL